MISARCRAYSTLRPRQPNQKRSNLMSTQYCTVSNIRASPSSDQTPYYRVFHTCRILPAVPRARSAQAEWVTSKTPDDSGGVHRTAQWRPQHFHPPPHSPHIRLRTSTKPSLVGLRVGGSQSTHCGELRGILRILFVFTLQMTLYWALPDISASSYDWWRE